jgi:hypothetical protein
MHFEGRELKDYAEPVSATELREGEVYFAVNYVDDEMLVPTMETIVFIGRNLEPGDLDQVYFQDIESHREGVLYTSDSSDGPSRFQAGAENQINHIFNYEPALEELMRCSLRRPKTQVK